MKNLLACFKFLKSYAGKLIIAFILLVVSTGLSLILPRISQWAIDSGIGESNITIVIYAAIALLIFGIIGSIINYFSGTILIKASQGMGYTIRNSLFKKVSTFSFADFDKWRTGELMVRLNSDVSTIQQFVRMGLFMLVLAILTLIGAMIGMFLIDTYLALVLSAIMVGTLILFYVFARHLRPLFKKVREKLDKLNNVIQENIAGAKLVRAFSAQKTEENKFDVGNKDYYKIRIKVGNFMSLLMPLLMAIGNFTALVAIWLGGKLVGHEELSLGELVAFNGYATMAVFPIMILAMVLNFMSMAMASADRVIELLNVTPSIQETNNAIKLDKLKGKIEFKNVNLHYGNGENAVCNLNFTIEAGEKIGIIGTTGSGKSSLVHLIPRFYDSTEGNVFIDDKNITEFSLDTVRRRINVALQETMLFSGTIADNIRYGDPKASDDEVEKASQLACAEEFILEKENKYKENVGVRGAGLSGGQRQRVAIARALLAKPDVLILDDVTSSLDGLTETKVLENIYNLAGSMTTIIISQKINAVKQADKIFVMDKGKIINIGKHNELLQKCELYNQINQTQENVTIS
jgi:ATP-binding cassette, subfamily B, multidrug efflux pump